MPALRVLVTTTDPAQRRTAVATFEGAGCEVRAADGADCVEQARVWAPDLLVVLPPLLWVSVAGLLAVLHDDPDTRHVPVLILTQPLHEGPLPLGPRSVVAGTAEGTEALPPLLERLRRRAPAFAPAASGPPAP
jgi:hypothetical protein